MEQWERDRQDYYKILQVDPSAEHEVIEAAYKRLALKYHPDRNPHNPKTTDLMKNLNKAYEVLGDSEKRRRYDSEWRKRSGKGADSRETYTPPHPKPVPVVEPTHISFRDVSPGVIQKASFVIRNNGGPYKKVSISNADPWVKVVRTTPLDPPQNLPLEVEIEAKGKDWGKTYTEHIKVKLDEEETQVKVELQTKPKPARKPDVIPARFRWQLMPALIIIGASIGVLIPYNWGGPLRPIMVFLGLLATPSISFFVTRALWKRNHHTGAVWCSIGICFILLYFLGSLGFLSPDRRKYPLLDATFGGGLLFLAIGLFLEKPLFRATAYKLIPPLWCFAGWLGSGIFVFGVSQIENPFVLTTTTRVEKKGKNSIPPLPEGFVLEQESPSPLALKELSDDELDELIRLANSRGLLPKTEETKGIQDYSGYTDEELFEMAGISTTTTTTTTLPTPTTMKTITSTTITTVTGRWVEVPGQWIGGQWAPAHKVWVPTNP